VSNAYTFKSVEANPIEARSQKCKHLRLLSRKHENKVSCKKISGVKLPGK